MITYEQFERSINAIKAYSDYESKLSNLGIDIWEREEVSNLITSYINLLSDSFGLSKAESYGSELDYWIYELEFGTDPSNLMEGEPDEEAFTTTLKALYDFLLSEGKV